MPGLSNEVEVDVRAKRNMGLDVELLCSKLEAHRRQQEVMLAKREKRDAQRDTRFLPKVAAKQFTATATPLRQDSVRQNRSNARGETAPEPHICGENTKPDHCSTAMAFGVRDPLGIAAIAKDRMGGKGREAIKRSPERLISKEMSYERHLITDRRPTSPHGPANRTSQSGHHSFLQRTEMQARPLIPRRHSSRNESGQAERDGGMAEEYTIHERPESVGAYRPGDAAKRRTMFDTSLRDNRFAGDNGDASDLSGRALQDSWLYDNLDQYTGHLPVFEESARNSEGLQRSKLLPHDRPDWCQRSQNGSSPHLLQLFSKSREKTMAGAQLRTHRDLSDRIPNHSDEKGEMENGRLIADAVRIIKDQERIRKRHSVLDFFKKL